MYIYRRDSSRTAAIPKLADGNGNRGDMNTVPSNHANSWEMAGTVLPITFSGAGSMKTFTRHHGAWLCPSGRRASEMCRLPGSLAYNLRKCLPALLRHCFPRLAKLVPLMGAGDRGVSLHQRDDNWRRRPSHFAPADAAGR